MRDLIDTGLEAGVTRCNEASRLNGFYWATRAVVSAVLSGLSSSVPKSNALRTAHATKRPPLMKFSPENIDYVLHLAYPQPKSDCEKRDCRQRNRDEQCR
jgi:hypothetical protein